MNLLAPILLSLRVATLATAVTLALGLGLARIFVSRPGPLARAWEPLVILPLVLPPIITGYLLLLLLGARGPLGSLLSRLGLTVIFTWGAAVIAAVIVSLPLMYQSCKAALLSVDSECEKAARSLGASEGRIFRRITLPLAAPGILAGTALSFARALGEFGATLLVAGNIPGRTQTITLALYNAVEGGRGRDANILLGVAVALSFGIVLLLGFFERRSYAGQQGRARREGGRWS